MKPTGSNLTHSHITGLDKLFISVLWALFALSVVLAIWHDALALPLTIGTLLAVIPTALCVAAPGKFGPRVAVAVALMLFCALNIHQTHGMTELHFGIFVLLAFLVCYQDWRIIIAAAATAAVHHLTFNFLQEWGYPTFCFTHPGLGIVLIHAAYVVVEAGVLSYLAIRLQRETATVINTTRALQRTLAIMHDSANVVASEMLLITEASNAVAANGGDLSRRATTQASSLGEAATAIDHLTATVKRNVNYAEDANRLVSLASAAATHGGEVVAEVVQTMDAIHSSSQKIGEIISVIDGIAFQTNILALNAAVEAARAGEQGRGFAVVASEVRTLAQRSAQAAKEVRLLITDSVEQVAEGGKLVHDAGQAMQQIVASVQQAAEVVAKIAHASCEQRDGMEQMRATMQEIAMTTQQTVSLVEQSSAAAETMCDHAASATQAVKMLGAQAA